MPVAGGGVVVASNHHRRKVEVSLCEQCRDAQGTSLLGRRHADRDDRRCSLNCRSGAVLKGYGAGKEARRGGDDSQCIRHAGDRLKPG